MRTAAALRIVRIDLLRRKAHWLVNGTQLATRGDGRGSTATAHIVLSGDWAGGVADTPHAYLVPHARYGLRSRSTAQEFVFGESCCGATAQREASRCVIVVLRARSRRSEEHTSELQSQSNLVCRLLLEKKKNTK